MNDVLDLIIKTGMVAWYLKWPILFALVVFFMIAAAVKGEARG